MMPDLGKYALEVSLAYVVSLALIGLLVLWTLARSRKVRAELRAFEAARKEANEKA